MADLGEYTGRQVQKHSYIDNPVGIDVLKIRQPLDDTFINNRSYIEYFKHSYIDNPVGIDVLKIRQTSFYAGSVYDAGPVFNIVKGTDGSSSSTAKYFWG